MNELQIKCLIAAAQSSSFSEAAENVYMTPPTFSRYISSLETELGHTLFVRGRQKIQLTAIGELMYEGFLEIQSKIDELKDKADKISSGTVGLLRIAILEGQLIDSKLRSILQYFHKHYEMLELQMHRYSFREMEDRLLTGKLDLGITLTAEVEHNGELNHVPFQSLKNYIVLPREHALAHKDPLHLIDLKDTPLLELDSEECHCISRRMRDCCIEAGFQPKVEKYPNLQSQLFALEAGLGMMPLNENHSACRNPNMIAREVDGLPKVDFCIAWRKDNLAPAIQLFLKSLNGNCNI